MTLKTPLTVRMPGVTVPPTVSSPEQPPVPDDRPSDQATDPTMSMPRPFLRDRANLTLLTGPSAGQVFPLKSDELVIGREASADVSYDDVAVSRKHARLVRQPNGEIVLEDLQSTNGTYVSGEPITRRVLRSGDQIQLGPNLLFRFAMTDATEERIQRQLFESSVRDPLTQAFNRKYLNERLAAEVAHARRHSTKLALLVLDLDDFKATNDRHGHLGGDAVLRQVAATVHALIRIEDVFARFGGEEFVVLTRGDGVHNASQLAERLRKAIADTPAYFEGASVGVTVSIGVADLDELPAPAGAEALLEKADARLYKAKSAGRNRVTCTDE